MEKDNIVKFIRAVECVEEQSLIEAKNCNKAQGYKIIQGSKGSYYAKEDTTLTWKENEPMASQDALGCKENDPDCDKDNSSSEAEVWGPDASQIRSKNLVHDLHLDKNASSPSKRSSKVVSPFEFHVSLENGVNLIVDLDASSSDKPKILGTDTCNCYFVRNINRFKNFREEIQLLRNCSSKISKFSLRTTDIDKPKDSDFVVVTHPYGADWSLRYSSSKPCDDVVKTPEQIENDSEVVNLSGTSCEGKGHSRLGGKFCLTVNQPVPAEVSISKSPPVISTVSTDDIVDSMAEGPNFLDIVNGQNPVIGEKARIWLPMHNARPCTSVNNVVSVSSSRGSTIEMQFSDKACRQKNEPSSPSRNGVLHAVVDPLLNLETEHDESFVSSTAVSAEIGGSIKVDYGADKTNTSPRMPLRKRPVMIVGVKRKKFGSEQNTMILRSSKLGSVRVLPRRSMRFIRA